MSSGDPNCPESDNNRTDPSTPGSTSENKAVKKDVLKKKLALKECFSSSHEPSTPDSGYFAVGSSSESPKDERVEKQRVSVGGALNAKPEFAVAHPILESSPGTIFTLPPPLEIPDADHSASHSGLPQISGTGLRLDVSGDEIVSSKTSVGFLRVLIELSTARSCVCRPHVMLPQSQKWRESGSPVFLNECPTVLLTDLTVPLPIPYRP